MIIVYFGDFETGKKAAIGLLLKLTPGGTNRAFPRQN